MIRSMPLLLVPLMALLATGCARPTPPAPAVVSQPAATPPSPSAEHGHRPGTHGGLIVEIGRDNYHAEAVFERGGVLRLYTLGRDESRVQEVEQQTVKAFGKVEGSVEAVPFELRPDPQPGDQEGRTSQLVGQLPAVLQGKSIEVTIPSLRVGGERFRLGFRTALDVHEEASMPAKVEDEEERRLYLTPGGRYTAADIAANGTVTASQKYSSFRAAHDLKPRPGDKLCPVTFTKANPRCTWVIAGQTYEFCCPPCIDEFVQQAKSEPDSLQPPEAFIKK